MECVRLATLACGGVLFSFAAVPYRSAISSLAMTGSLLTTTTFYIVVAVMMPQAHELLILAALLIGLMPLSIAILTLRALRHPLRWIIVSLYGTLSVYLLVVQFRPGMGLSLALHGLLFAIFFGCALHIAYCYSRTTAGALITITGFLAWALVFILQLASGTTAGGVALDSEVWNLPMYVVAVGMVLLLLENQLEQSHYLALHDELTGLPNRRLFIDRLALSIERARRSHQRCALLVVDLNRFKMVNDALGHHAGDQLLQHVAGVFSARVRSSDTVARTGGDEFSVILENPNDSVGAQHVAEYLLEQLNTPMQMSGRLVRVGASIGVAVYPDDAQDMEMLRVAADLRMYSHKNQERDATNKNEERLLTFPDVDNATPEMQTAQERSHA